MEDRHLTILLPVTRGTKAFSVLKRIENSKKTTVVANKDNELLNISTSI